MMRVTEAGWKRGCRAALFAFLLGAGGVRAEPLDGIWKYVSSSEFFGEANLLAPPAQGSIQVLDGKLALSPTCVVKLTPEPYSFSLVFQNLLRQKVGSEELAKYLNDKFAFNLRNVQASYKVEKAACAKDLQELLLEGERMLAVASNTIFYSFRRGSDMAKPAQTTSKLKQKISPLPFNLVNFMSLCDPVIPRVKGVPQVTSKCAPSFYPYVATRNDDDTIAKVVGRHQYIKGDPKYHHDYNDPVSNGLHPLYMVLPPLKDILLVRVQDSEGGGEDRDVFSGAYLSIKNGVVVDQLNEGCSINSDYICTDRDGKKLFRLLETGKFSRL